MIDKVAIIIVNWNGYSYLKDCFTAIQNQTFRNFDVYFVDNGSEDDSVAFIKSSFPDTKIIQLNKNVGFAEGNNIALREIFKDAEIKYVVTLNNDTKADNKFLANLVRLAESNKQIGSIAPKMIYYHQNNLIDSIGVTVGIDGGGLGRGSKEIDNHQYDEEEEIFGVCAGAALFRKEALEDAMIEDEVFDKIFFAYYEDFDLDWRLRLKGWISFACPNAIVHHIHSATSKSFSPFKSYYINRNRFFIIIKDLPAKYFWRAVLLTPYRYLLLFNSIRIKKGPSHELSKNTSPLLPIKITLQGWGSVIRYMHNMLKKRSLIQKNKTTDLKTVATWFKRFPVSMKDMIYK
ncbi:MAG: glycosyltransferase family 2 protein [Patescibacteria group bacterium]|jgi:hypothetical protein